MFSKMALGNRMLLQVLTVTILAFGVTIGVVSIQASRTARTEAMEKANEIACRGSELIKSDLMEGLSTARLLGKTAEGILRDRKTISRLAIDQVYLKSVECNNLFFGTWLMIEPDKFDGRNKEIVEKDGHDKTGIYSPYAYRENGKVVLIQSNFGESHVNEYYQVPMKTGREFITNPYIEPEANNIMMCSVSVPISDNGKLVGVAGVDMELTSFVEKLKTFKPFGSGYAFLVSNAGTIVSHPKKEYLGKNASEIGISKTILEAIKQGKPAEAFETVGKKGQKAYVKYVPIVIGQTQVPWSFAISIPMDQVLAKSRTIIQSTLIIGVVSVVVLTILLVYAFRRVNRTLNTITEVLRGGAMQVAKASEEISLISKETAQGASEQASQLEETSAALEEMASMAKGNAEGAEKANSLMNQTTQVVGQSQNLMSQSTEAMGKIKEANSEISHILKVIEEIAFQTNLLALNAAVEAARAGEHGKGFAVVAAEVRNLAQRSAQAANETSQLIADTTDRVKRGHDLNQELENSFTQVSEASSQVAMLVGQITQASREQAKGVDLINQTVSQMDKIVQQSAAGAEKAALSIEELASQAQILQRSVNELAELINGQAGPAKQKKPSNRKKVKV